MLLNLPTNQPQDLEGLSFPSRSSDLSLKRGIWEAEGVASGYKTFADTTPYRQANVGLINLINECDVSLDGILAYDLGSGTGAGTSLLAAQVGKGSVIGIDLSEAMTQFARESLKHLANVRSIVGDAADLQSLSLPTPNAVLAFNSITLFPNLPDLLGRIFTLLPERGVLAFNNTLILDAVESSKMGSMMQFTRNVLRLAKISGIDRNRHPHQQFPHSERLREMVQDTGFKVLKYELSSYDLSREDMRQYTHVPGTFLELIPSYVGKEKRTEILDAALDLMPINVCFPRRWCSIVAIKD